MAASASTATNNARRRGLKAIMLCSDKCRCCRDDAIASTCVGKRFGEKVINGGPCIRRAQRWYAANLAAAIRRDRVDILRLGGAALFYPDHDLRVRALFRDPCGLR